MLNSADERDQDDSGNMCHSGFLSVARKMIRPVAARLRSLLEEDPSRASCSLLMTGHSAGGAVASLLYAHMMAEHVKSELNILTGCMLESLIAPLLPNLGICSLSLTHTHH